MPAENTTYRADIDGLRAVAVLAVVLFHADLGLPGGYIGVDVFFVISGFLITQLVMKDLGRGTFSLRHFWERRVRRIAPAMVVVVAAVLIAGYFLLLPTDYTALGKSVIGLVLLSSNVYFFREVGYFGRAAEEQPLLHTWSLAVEEQFYLFVPLVPLLIIWLRSLRRFSWLLAALAVLSLVLSIYLIRNRPSAGFYLLPPRAWELFAGVLLALVGRPSTVGPSRPREVAAIIGIAGILVPCAWYDASTPFPGLAAIPPVAGTVLLIAAGCSAHPPAVNLLLARRLPVLVGLISYSLYLWHWPLFAFAKYWAIHPLTFGQRAGIVVASLALAYISWRYVELPFRTRKLLATRRGIVTAMGLALAIQLAYGIAIHHAGGFSERLPPHARRFVETGTRDPRFTRSLDAADVPDNLTRLGDPAAPAEVLVWGDSHAMAILPAIDALCREMGVAGRAATASSTAPVVGYYSRQRGVRNEAAIRFNAAVAESVVHKRFRTVVLAATWGSYADQPGFTTALLATVDFLRARGAEVYFLKDVPVYEFNVPNMLALYCWNGWDLRRLGMPLAEYEAHNHFHQAVLPRLLEKGVVVLDPVPAIRARNPHPTILPYDDGGSFYFDRRHLSSYGALALEGFFTPVVAGRCQSHPKALPAE